MSSVTGALHCVRCTPEVVTAPPTEIRQSTWSLADPCARIPSDAKEFDITLQPFSLTSELPENSAALEAEGWSAKMQALAEVWKVATALAVSATGPSSKIAVK